MDRGGGVLIAVNSKFNSKQCKLLNDSDDIEQICVCVSSKGLSSKDFYFIASYIRPRSTIDLYSVHIININSLISELTTDQYPCVLGDFNLGEIDWCFIENEFTLVPFNTYKEIESLVVDSLSSLNLFQINHITNYLGRILDLVFINNDLKYCIETVQCPLLNNSVHHIAFELNFEFYEFALLSPTEDRNFNFVNADFIALNSFYSAFDWENIFQNGSLKDMYTIFKSILFEGLELFVPISKKKTSLKLPWHNKRLKNLENVKNKAFKRFKLTGQNFDRFRFLQFRREFDFLNRFLYKQYINSTESNIRKNSKSFWIFINSKRKNVSHFPQCMEYGNEKSNDLQSSTDLFAKFFKSSYNKDIIEDLNSKYSNFNADINFVLPHLSVNEVLDGLCELDVSKKAGYDKIPPLLLSKCSSSICFPLTLLYNKSLLSGEFVDEWKISFINPIYKSGPKQLIKNYRPISKISAIPKLLEKIITDKFYASVKQFLSPSQHGFIKGRSSATNLVLFTNFCLNEIEKGFQVDVLYTDFIKAFDRVHHGLLLQKLKLLGCDRYFLLWLESYLSDRSQIVNISGYYSNPISVDSGLPQGSHLGPLLFLIFINDLPLTFHKSKCLMYADDVKMFYPIRSLTDCLSFQMEIDLFLNWCEYNHLELNSLKCKIFSATRSINAINYSYNFNHEPLSRVELVKDLGVFVDSKLDFRAHIDFVVSKGNSMLGFIRRNSKEFRDVYTLKTLFNSLVLPYLEYCSIIWSPFYANSVQRIERIQKRFTRFALRNLYWTDDMPNYISRCALIDLKTLEVRRNTQSIIFIKDILCNRIDSIELLSLIKFYVPERLLRNRRVLFYVSNHRTNYGLNEPISRSLTLFNSVCNEVDIVVSRDQFKRQVLDFLTYHM